MKKYFLFVVSLLAVLFAVSITACSDDSDDALLTDISGTAWRITSSNDFDFRSGSVIEFHKNGSLNISSTFGNNIWKVKNDNLIMIFNDDQTIGKFIIDGETATYQYHWEGVSDGWISEENYSLLLQRIDNN